METEYQLLYAASAMQLELIDHRQMADVCGTWLARRDWPLAALLREWGWLSVDDEGDVERLMSRKLRRHGGDARTSLWASVDAETEAGLQQLIDMDVVQRLASARPGEPESVAEEQTMATPSSVDTGDDDTVEIEVVRDDPGCLEYCGQLQLLEKLESSGGFDVYHARDHELNRDVIVKACAGRGNGARLSRAFLLEAQIIAQLDHPHVITIHGLGRRLSDGRPCLVFRPTGRLTLGCLIRNHHGRNDDRRRDPVGLNLLILRLVEVCSAVAYAHARGVIHRDLKPNRVAIGRSGEALLSDWHLARIIDQPDTNVPPIRITAEAAATQAWEEGIVGAPVFMPPELIAGDGAGRVNPRTDLYALGVSLFQILTGQLPFARNRSGVMELFQAIVAGPTPRASEVVRSIPAALDAICARAMARHPVDRYATASELEDDLKGWLDGGPILAYPESRARRAWRRFRHDISSRTTNGSPG